MRISFAQLFDVALLAGSKIAQDITPFIDFCNKGFDEIVRALKNQLTFADNFKCQIIEAKLKHGEQAKLKLKEANVFGVIPVRTNVSTNSVASLNFSVDQEQQLLVTPGFAVATNVEYTVTLVVLFQ